MLKKNPKTRCERLVMEKAKGVCRFYNKIQSAYARILEENEEVEEICCNVAFETEELSGYTSDFVCAGKRMESFWSGNVWSEGNCLGRQLCSSWMHRGIIGQGVVLWIGVL